MIRFPKIICNNVSISITIAMWTIVQIIVHTYGLMYVQWWRNCKLEKSYNFYVFLFGDFECNFNETATDDKINDFDPDSWLTNQLDKIVFVHFIFNSLWVVSSVGLLTGACCVIREIWALVFYLPWVVMSIIILIYDVFCTIYFGAHIPSTGTFFDWFSFLGITSKISDIQHMENDSFDMILGAVSIIMTFVSCRAVVIWIGNLILLIFIIRIARREYNSKYDQCHIQNNINREDCEKRIKPPEREEKKPIVRTNSQRIRDWHRFYDSVRYKKEKMQDDGAEKFYDCIDDQDLLEACNYRINSAAKKNELLLSVQSFDQSVPSTSKATWVDIPLSNQYGEPSSSYSDKRTFRIVDRDDQDDSEPDENFNSSGKDSSKTQNALK